MTEEGTGKGNFEKGMDDCAICFDVTQLGVGYLPGKFYGLRDSTPELMFNHCSKEHAF
jgi:hypothetical protein